MIESRRLGSEVCVVIRESALYLQLADFERARFTIMRMCETILPRVTQIMDVHRVRFVDLQPQSIQCLAFSSYNDKDQLAVSRADASIELWCQCNGKELRHELTIPGRSDLSVETMGWMQDRLFSSGLTGWKASSILLYSNLCFIPFPVI